MTRTLGGPNFDLPPSKKRMSLTTSVPKGSPPGPDTELDRLTGLLARFEALFESVPLALAVFDETLMLVRANTRFNELTGGSVVPGYGRSVYDAFPNALADCTDLIDGALRDREADELASP